MDIDTIIAPYSIADITRIYHGLDHCCRCGCGGKYFEKGTKGFVRALNALKKLPWPSKNDIVYTRDGRTLKCEGIDKTLDYVNIPSDPMNDKCYCLYFR